jgi:uncharacterized phage protein gp47/JayE
MITLLSKDELRADLLASLKGLLPQILTSKDTDAGALVEMLVDALIGLQYLVQGVEDDLFVDTASSEALDKHADAHFAEGRKVATTTDVTESGVAFLGTAGAVVPAGTTLVHDDGTRYITTADGTISALGTVVVPLQSITTGLIANKDQWELLTLESPPSGVESEAEIFDAQVGASDQETDAELVVRLLDVIRNPHAGGRCSDYRQWACEVKGILSAYVYAPSSVCPDGRRGMGTVDIAVLLSGSGGDRIPTAANVADVQEYIDDRRPAGVKEVLVLLPAEDAQDFDIEVEPEDGYEFDWDDGGTSYTVNTFAPSTLTLTWSAAPPADVVAGVRLLVDGELLTVVSKSGSDTVVDVAPTLGAGVAGKAIWPAGPITEPVQDAIRALMDSLGPARGDAYDPGQAGWDDTLRLSKLNRAILGVQGVLDATINTPAANVVPDDHAPSGTVDLLTYDCIIVRPA